MSSDHLLGEGMLANCGATGTTLTRLGRLTDECPEPDDPALCQSGPDRIDDKLRHARRSDCKEETNHG